MATSRRLLTCELAKKLVMALMSADRLIWFEVTPYPGKRSGESGAGCIVTIAAGEQWPDVIDPKYILDEWTE